MGARHCVRVAHLWGTMVLLNSLALGTCLGSTLTIEFRIAAHPERNGEILVLASGEAHAVFVGGTLRAKWVPTSKDLSCGGPQWSSLVTRTNASGSKEVLVLVSKEDLTESKIKEVYPGVGRQGDPALVVIPDGEGASDLKRRTRMNIGRYLVQIIDGRVASVGQIKTVIYDYALLDGHFTDEMIANMVWRFEGAEGPPGVRAVQRGLRVTTSSLLAVVVAITFIVLGLLPCPNMKVRTIHKVVGTVLGALAMAAYLGIETRCGTSQMPSGEHIITREVHIGLLWILLGLAAGAPLGLAAGVLLGRAIFNVRRILSRAKRTVGS